MEFDYSLLRDIHEGVPPSDYSVWWLWVILRIFVAGFVFYVLYRLFPLFMAYLRLRKIDIKSEAFVPLINYWLKETALIMYPRERIAGLCGEKWLEFLDRPDSVQPQKDIVSNGALNSFKSGSKYMEQQIRDSEFEKVASLYQASRTSGREQSVANNSHVKGGNGTSFELFTTAWNQVIYDYHNIGINDKEKKMLVSQCKKWLFANLRRRLWVLR